VLDGTKSDTYPVRNYHESSVEEIAQVTAGDNRVAEKLISSPRRSSARSQS